MFRELTNPIPYWNRYKGANGGTRYHVRTEDGHGYLAVDKHIGGTFIDTTCTFFFESLDEAWDAACRYYSWYKMVYPYVLVCENDKAKFCVHMDGSAIIHDKEPLETTESQKMEFE